MLNGDPQLHPELLSVKNRGSGISKKKIHLIQYVDNNSMYIEEVVNQTLLKISRQ